LYTLFTRSLKGMTAVRSFFWLAAAAETQLGDNIILNFFSFMIRVVLRMARC
jgi:hypothetical protein